MGRARAATSGGAGALRAGRAGHQEAPLVAAQPSLDARGERLAADEDEERIRAELPFFLARVVGDEHRLEPIVSPRGDHARARANRDPWVPFDALDEVVGHGVGRRVGADDQRHPTRELDQVKRGLAGRVGAAHDDDLAVAMERRLAGRRAVEDAGADRALDPLGLELPVVDARGDHGAARPKGCTVRQLERSQGAVAAEEPHERIAVDVDPLERDAVSLQELARVGCTRRCRCPDQVLNAHLVSAAGALLDRMVEAAQHARADSRRDRH